MARITSLPDAEWARLLDERDALIAAVCSPTVDEARVTAAVRDCYQAIGVPAPPVVWVDGPLSVLTAGAMLGGQLRDQLWGQLGGQLGDQLRGQLGDQLGGQLGDQLRGQLRGQLGDQLWGQLRGQLGGQLRGQLRGQLGGQLWGQLRGQLGDQLWGQLRGQLRGQLGDQLQDQLWGQLGDQLWGQLQGQLWGQLRGQLGDQLRGQLRGQLGGVVSSGWWLGSVQHWLLIDTIDGVRRLDDDLRRKAEAWRDALLCHWWLPLRGVAIMSRPHTGLRLDNRGRLHCATGPAWAWADGTTVHALEGVRVPSWVIDTPDPARFLTDLDNTEQRRVAFAAYGWDRAIEHLKLTPIDVHPDPHLGALYRLPETLIDSTFDATLLLCRNASPHADGTWQTYGLLADGGARTVIEAQASLARLTVAEWEQIQVTT